MNSDGEDYVDKVFKFELNFFFMEIGNLFKQVNQKVTHPKYSEGLP